MMVPTRSRTTWMGIDYGTSVIICGGFAPAIAVWLIQKFETPNPPLYYVMFGALVSGLVALSARETAFEPSK